MTLIRINHDPSRRQLAVFAVGWTLSLGLIGWLLPVSWGDVSLRAVCWVLAAVVPAVGLTVPGFLKGTYLISAYAAMPIGVVVSYVILAMIYFLVFAPIGLALRLGGHDPLNRRFDPDLESYWVERPTATDRRRYFRQF